MFFSFFSNLFLPMGKILLAKRGNLVKNYINANAFWIFVNQLKTYGTMPLALINIMLFQIFINGINQTRADGIPPKTLS
jgi:hypothetical protein